MELKTYLKQYSQKANRYLDTFFSQEQKKAAKIAPLCAQTMAIYREYMRGGKMARGAFTYLGYQSAGGKDEKVVLPASVAIEILHSFLLIHDDWIDKDILRRGKPTVHAQYQKIFKQKKWRGDVKHWAAGMAIVLGDIGNFLAHQILSSLDCPAKYKAKAIFRLSDYLVKTGYGEALEITLDFDKKTSYKDVLTIRELKTAYYTIVMPLATGAALAGADEKKIEAIENFGLPVGIAFQLRDDELGLFGDKKTIGKSTLSDLLGGKKTMLILKALENLSGQDKKFLLSVWGNGDVSVAQVTKAKTLILKSGALEFSQKTAKRLVEKGKKFVPQITADPELQDTLYKMANFMIEREF